MIHGWMEGLFPPHFENSKRTERFFVDALKDFDDESMLNWNMNLKTYIVANKQKSGPTSRRAPTPEQRAST